MAKKRKTAGEGGSTKDVMSVQLTTRAREKVEALAEKYGIQKTKLVQRVLTWLSDQPEEVQHQVIVPVPPGLRSAYADALEKLAQAVRQGQKSPPAAGSAIVDEEGAVQFTEDAENGLNHKQGAGH